MKGKLVACDSSIDHCPQCGGSLTVKSLREELAHMRSPSNPHHLSAPALAKAIAAGERHLAFFVGVAEKEKEKES